MTNADVIRQMTDDELYEFLSEWECGDIDYAVTFCDLCNDATKRGEVGNVLNLDCDGCRKHWLNRDADGYGGLRYWERYYDFTDRKTENSSEKPNNCKDEPQTDWHYDEQDATWYPYKHEDEPQQKSCATCKHALGNWDGESNNCGRCCGADRRFYESIEDEPQTVETMSCAECKHRPIGAEICEEPCHYEPKDEQTERSE